MILKAIDGSNSLNFASSTSQPNDSNLLTELTIAL